MEKKAKTWMQMLCLMILKTISHGHTGNGTENQNNDTTRAFPLIMTKSILTLEKSLREAARRRLRICRTLANSAWKKWLSLEDIPWDASQNFTDPSAWLFMRKANEKGKWERPMRKWWIDIKIRDEEIYWMIDTFNLDLSPLFRLHGNVTNSSHLELFWPSDMSCHFLSSWDQTVCATASPMSRSMSMFYIPF